MKKTIFITGGLGYIGSAFAKEAIKKGYKIILYDSLIYEQNRDKIMSEIKEGKQKAKVKYIIGDTRNLELLEKSIIESKPDYIFHLGELSSVYMCDHNPSYTEDINYKASKGVIDLCEKLNIPTFYNSTSSLYGNQKTMKLMIEKDPIPTPMDNYCKYKLKMEDYIKAKVSKNKKFKIIVFRPATICGVSPRMRMELLPNHFTYCAVSKGIIKASELDSFRAAMDIRDFVNGYFAVLKKGSWKNLIYNIGHLNLSKRQFINGIQSVVKSELVTFPGIGDLRNLQIDCSLFNNEFNFKPSISYEKTVKEISKWMKKNLIEIEKTNFAGILNMSLDRFLKTI
ncbi:MAG TPA: NAD(P)-dependent oxidoreductase [Candidatus Paceibacterota bacterium]